MRKWIYRGGNTIIREQNQLIWLEYYLEEDYRDIDKSTCLYGIRIELYREVNGHIYVEQECAPAISYSREYVCQMIDRMKKEAVTPMCLLEIVDEEVSRSYYEEIFRMDRRA